MNTPKPMEGTWVLVAPNGREYTGLSPMQALRAEQAERVPSELALERILLSAESTQDERDAVRYRWLRAQNWNDGLLAVVADPKAAVKLGQDCPSLDRLDEQIDAAMLAERVLGDA